MTDWPDPGRWGTPPWSLPPAGDGAGLPDGGSFDLAVIGGGFSGLAAALEALRLDRGVRVVVLEAGRVGSGASGRTGGIVLEATAAGPAPGFDGCLEGLSAFLTAEGIDCALSLGGCWEVGRSDPPGPSPIAWDDGGVLRVQRTVPGGTLDPGAFLAGRVRALRGKGGEVREGAAVRGIDAGAGWVRLQGETGRCRARKVALTGDAPVLGAFGGAVQPYQTLALAVGPLPAPLLSEIGWSSGTPFYTQDLPYLWGRPSPDHGAIIGSGLVPFGGAASLDEEGPRSLLADLEGRVRGLHPVLRSVRVTHRWAGPIGLTEDFRPRFERWKGCPDALAAAGFCGHGVALSVRVGRLLAGALLKDEPLPPGPEPADR